MFIPEIQLHSFLLFYSITPNSTMLTVICIWVTYSPITWDDREDIIRVTKHKANLILCNYKVRAADPFVKCFLIKSYCLSATLWSLLLSSIRLIEVALHKILRKAWNLSYRSHTGIFYCISRIPTISNILYDRFCSFFSRAVSSSSFLVRSILLILLTRALKCKPSASIMRPHDSYVT